MYHGMVQHFYTDVECYIGAAKVLQRSQLYSEILFMLMLQPVDSHAGLTDIFYLLLYKSLYQVNMNTSFHRE